jgi:hypothetical protein
MVAFGGPLLLQSCTRTLPHGEPNPLFELKGKHKTVPCEGCHGDGKPRSLPTVCIDCHDNDRPAPDHNPGRNCFPCHTEDGWDVGHTDTGLTPTETGPTETGLTEPTGFDHAALPLDKLCWDCHELVDLGPPEIEGGAPRKDATHYTSPTPDQVSWWDCGPCHNYTAPWDEDYIVHPPRTPHGSLQDPDPLTWVVACADCHQDETNYALFDCEMCHVQRNPAFYPHFGDAQVQGPLANESCKVCHPHGDDTQ